VKRVIDVLVSIEFEAMNRFRNWFWN